MESDAGRLKGRAQAEWFLLKAKLALAVAVIRTRPEGMSGRQHAEDLSRRLRSADERWREKVHGLEQEVLRLRQQELINRVTNSTETPDFASQDLFGAGKVAPEPSNGSETPDLLLEEAEPLSGVCTFPKPNALFPHVHFLQSLCALSRAHSGSGGALWHGTDSDGCSLVANSVCELLDCVVKACGDTPTPGSRDLVLEACSVSVRAVELLGSWKSVEFRNHLEKVLKELMELLLHSSDWTASEKLCECVMVLGNSSIPRFFLIRLSLSEISTLTNQLWQDIQNQSGSCRHWFPLNPYQNSCHLFTILEVLLQRLEVWEQVEVREELKDALSALHSRVFSLSEEFPLFSVRLWRIAALLGSSSFLTAPPPDTNGSSS